MMRFDPSITSDCLPQYVRSRTRSIHRVVSALAERQDSQTTRTCAAALGDLDSAVATALVLHPAHHVWWLQLHDALRGRDEATVLALSHQLPAHLIGAAVHAGVLLPGLTWSTSGGDARVELPPANARLDGLDSSGPVRMRQISADEVEVVHNGDMTVWSPRAGTTRGGPGVPWSARRIGDSTVLDATSHWAETFLEHQNRNTPAPDGSAGDRRPSAEADVDIDKLGANWRRLKSVWPEMAREVDVFAPVLVPVDTAFGLAFTNTACQGAIFLTNDGFGRDVRNIERLVHETSHLRLNLEMTMTAMHHHSWSDTVASPFRAGPRPVTGLFHGAVVFARAAAALGRTARTYDDDDAAQRVPTLIALVRQAMYTIDAEVRLTPIGATLIDDVRQVCDELDREFGSVDPDSVDESDEYGEQASASTRAGGAD